MTEDAAIGALPVYQHRTHGWEYIPVHPFGDESEVLERWRDRPVQLFDEADAET